MVVVGVLMVCGDDVVGSRWWLKVVVVGWWWLGVVLVGWGGGGWCGLGCGDWGGGGGRW